MGRTRSTERVSLRIPTSIVKSKQKTLGRLSKDKKARKQGSNGSSSWWFLPIFPAISSTQPFRSLQLVAEWASWDWRQPSPQVHLASQSDHGNVGFRPQMHCAARRRSSISRLNSGSKVATLVDGICMDRHRVRLFVLRFSILCHFNRINDNIDRQCWPLGQALVRAASSNALVSSFVAGNSTGRREYLEWRMSGRKLFAIMGLLGLAASFRSGGIGGQEQTPPPSDPPKVTQSQEEAAQSADAKIQGAAESADQEGRGLVRAPPPGSSSRTGPPSPG